MLERDLGLGGRFPPVILPLWSLPRTARRQLVVRGDEGVGVGPDRSGKIQAGAVWQLGRVGRCRGGRRERGWP